MPDVTDFPGQGKEEGMKNILVVFLLICLAGTGAAQQETLFSKRIHSGGFGGPVVKFSQFNDEFGVLIGGRGGWIINHSFSFGGGGYGLVTDIPAPAPADSLTLGLGYGGLELEYINRSDKLIHFTLQTLIGAGGISCSKEDGDEDEDDDEDDESHSYEAFFIVEPAFNLIVNISPRFRIGFGVSYRFVSNFADDIFNKSSIDGLSGVLTFKFGRF